MRMVQPSQRTSLIVATGMGILLAGAGAFLVSSDCESLLGAVLVVIGSLVAVGGGFSWYFDHEAANARQLRQPYRHLRNQGRRLIQRMETVLDQVSETSDDPSLGDFALTQDTQVFTDARMFKETLRRRGVKRSALGRLGCPPSEKQCREQIDFLRSLVRYDLHWSPIVRWRFNRKAERDLRAARGDL